MIRDGGKFTKVVRYNGWYNIEAPLVAIHFRYEYNLHTRKKNETTQKFDHLHIFNNRVSPIESLKRLKSNYY